MHVRLLMIALLVLVAGCSDNANDSAAEVTDAGFDSGDLGNADGEPDVPEDTADAADVADTPDVWSDTPDVADAPDTPDADAEVDIGPPFSWEAAAPQPLTVVDGLPLTPAQIADFEPELFVIDTLSQTIFVDSATIGDDLFHEEAVVIGDADLGMRVVKGRDMTPDEVWLGEDIGGLIGQLFFTDRFTFVDYPNREVRFLVQAPGEDAPSPPGWDGVTPWEVQHEMPNFFPVAVADIGGVDVPLLTDTSSRLSVITQSVFDAQPVDEPLPQRHGFRYISNFGEDDGFVTRMPEVRFGDLVVRDLVVVVIPDDNHLRAVLEPNRVFVEGFLGAQFWQRFAVGIDGHVLAMGNSEGGTRRFLLWGDGSEPAELAGAWTKVGVELTLREGAVRVEMVYEGTDAAEAGVAVGDRLLSVDGTDVPGMSLEEIRAALRGEPGELHELRLLRGEETLTVQVAVEDLL